MVEDSDDENISIDNSLSSDESEGDEEDSDFPKQPPPSKVGLFKFVS